MWKIQWQVHFWPICNSIGDIWAQPLFLLVLVLKFLILGHFFSYTKERFCFSLDCKMSHFSIKISSKTFFQPNTYFVFCYPVIIQLSDSLSEMLSLVMDLESESDILQDVLQDILQDVVQFFDRWTWLKSHKIGETPFPKPTFWAFF